MKRGNNQPSLTLKQPSQSIRSSKQPEVNLSIKEINLFLLCTHIRPFQRRDKPKGAIHK